jgi:uncharacterized protein (TIGR00730 family)
MNKQITIFCASSPGIPAKYFKATQQLTELLVNNNYDIIYGGGATGLMGTVADTTLKMGGHIKGIIPKFMIEVEWEHKGVKDMIHVEDMRHRKKLLIKNTNAVVALPGGTGTLEELYEVVSLKKLGFFPHPIILLNVDGYFDPIAEMASKMVAENFMQKKHLEIWRIVNTPIEVIEAIKNQKPWGPEVINFAAVPSK